MTTRDPIPSAKLTYDDYRLLPQDGRRHEIIEGEHFVTPSPGLRHQRILGDLYWHLQAFLRQNGLGQLHTPPFHVVMSEADVVQPDLVFVAQANPGLVTNANVRGIPDLVAEVLSPRSRKLDERIKFKRYEHFGVQEYWLVDSELQVIKSHRHTEGGFARVAELSLEQEAPLRSPLLPGFFLPLWQIFQG